MAKLAFEMLGRVTWSVGKRRVRNYFAPVGRHRVQRALLIAGTVAVGVVAGAAALERASAQ